MTVAIAVAAIADEEREARADREPDELVAEEAIGPEPERRVRADRQLVRRDAADEVARVRIVARERPGRGRAKSTSAPTIATPMRGRAVLARTAPGGGRSRHVRQGPGRRRAARRRRTAGTRPRSTRTPRAPRRAGSDRTRGPRSDPSGRARGGARARRGPCGRRGPRRRATRR